MKGMETMILVGFTLTGLRWALMTWIDGVVFRSTAWFGKGDDRKGKREIMPEGRDVVTVYSWREMQHLEVG